MKDRNATGLATRRRRRSLLLALALTAAQSIAVSSGESGAALERGAPRCRVRVRATPPEADAGTRATSFSATEIQDLEIEVLFPRRLAGEHELVLELSTPQGHLYQKMTVPFRVAEEAATGQRRRSRRTRRVQGYPEPVAEVEATRVSAGSSQRVSVRATLPVAGTSIVTNSLYGRWAATAFLDRGERPCSRPSRFILTP